jgi:flagellar biosynthesis protein
MPDKDLNPLNKSKSQRSSVAVAVESGATPGEVPRITAAGRGKIAEQIVQLAFEKGIKVREDKDLAEILAQIELDSPIPSEAFLAVAEILSYVFRANGEPDPFNAVLARLDDLWSEDAQAQLAQSQTDIEKDPAK